MSIMHAGFSLLVALFLSLLHNGQITTNTTFDADITPTVTVTPTVTPTGTPDVTVTPTDVPSVTPTDVPTITPTVTPSATPSVSPSITPSGDGDKDDMFDLGASIKAFFGLSNAAAHHEINEQRFIQKHGHSRHSED